MALGQRIVTDSLGQQVADAIRSDILSGRLLPGEALQQDAVCLTFGTSRMPVRDALRQLCHEGFLIAAANNQVSVATFTRPDVEDMFEVQALLSGRLTKRATERSTTADLLLLEGLHEQMDALTQRGQLDELWDLNRAFHRRIDALGASPKLEASLRTVTIDLHRDVLYLTDKHAVQSNRQHAELLGAMRDGRAQQAEAIMASHVLEARDEVLRHLVAVGVLQG